MFSVSRRRRRTIIVPPQRSREKLSKSTKLYKIYFYISLHSYEIHTEKNISVCISSLFYPCIFFIQDPYVCPRRVTLLAENYTGNYASESPECPFFGRLVRGKQAGEEETTQRFESWAEIAGAIAAAAAASSALRYRRRKETRLGLAPKRHTGGRGAYPYAAHRVAAIWNYIRTTPRCRGYIPLSFFPSPSPPIAPSRTTAVFRLQSRPATAAAHGAVRE